MILSVIAGILLLGLCVFFHELGHFFVGKWLGVTPKIFSIGYGKGRWCWKKGPTTYQITAIPLGGYVQFYGDDPTQEHTNLKKGDFFFASPWARGMIAFAGPLFSFLLGIGIIFTLMTFGWQPMTNKVKVSPNSPAAQMGLKNNDQIIELNGEKTHSYDQIQYKVAFAYGEKLPAIILRDGKKIPLSLQTKQIEEGFISRIPGLMPAGEEYLFIASNSHSNKNQLLKNDRILSINKIKVTSFAEFRKAIEKIDSDMVELQILRENEGFFTSETQTLLLKLPLKRREFVHLKGGKINLSIGEWQSNIWQKIKLNGVFAENWKQFKQEATDEEVILEHNGVKYLVSGEIKTREKMLGIDIFPISNPEKADQPTDILSLFSRTWNESWFVGESTIVGLFHIIQGKLSFRKSVSGPIKIVNIAAKTARRGWVEYLLLLSKITIVLGVMNLLPIPVLDGGHILFYLIEAIYRPLPIHVIATTTRISMALLMTMGIYVIFQDIFDVFIKRFL